MKFTEKIRPFLMFEGEAEEAMNYYVSLFPQSEIVEVLRYGPHQSGPEGSVIKARFTLCGQPVWCTDSPIQHEFTFTPSISFFVTCDSEEEIRRLATSLATGGTIFMPLGSYGFSRLFTWVADRYGVTWQLTLD